MDGGRTVLVRIEGRVQGVGFRYWTRREAEALGLSGWVRNEEDGAVAALLCGAPEAVETMLARLRRGPRGATVAGVSAQESDAPAPQGFRIAG